MESNGLTALPCYVEDPQASAADDLEAERAINALPDNELFELAAFAAEWDEDVAEGREEAINRRNLVRRPPVWLLPVAIISILVIIWAGVF